MLEFVLNKAQRLTFDTSSPNGILLFREVSKLLVAYGTRILSVPSTGDIYGCKYKGIWISLTILARGKCPSPHALKYPFCSSLQFLWSSLKIFFKFSVLLCWFLSCWDWSYWILNNCTFIITLDLRWKVGSNLSHPFISKKLNVQGFSKVIHVCQVYCNLCAAICILLNNSSSFANMIWIKVIPIVSIWCLTFPLYDITQWMTCLDASYESVLEV